MHATRPRSRIGDGPPNCVGEVSKERRAMPKVQRFLVKMPPVAQNMRLSVAGHGAVFIARPLFTSIAPPGAGLAAASIWHIVEAPIALDVSNPWDVCHAMVTQGLGLADGARPEFAEPDLQQQWLSRPQEDRELALSATCKATKQDSDFPRDADNLWFQNDPHIQSASALESLPLPNDDSELICIAHLDTGYDPAHRSLPKRLETALQRNFVDADRPHDATDDSSGLFNNLGHGTGTLSILAGTSTVGLPRLGVAPFVKVVPIRVANRVELFYNSAIAQALDYVHGLGAAGGANAVSVVSMSMGGLASRAWADAVNALYEAGVVVVTAAGNNFGNLPTRHIVYPARFNRVIAACGIMADQSPYADLPVTKMAGNYGPDSKMWTAMSAYTPNVPWAKFGCSEVVDFDGAGTSAATPQIAAAAAMWLQKNKATCAAYGQLWMRVEAVRRALFSSASPGDRSKLGNGALRVAAALAVAPPSEVELKKEKADTASFAFLRVLTGLGISGMSEEQRAMLELEALQLSQSATIEVLLPDPDVDPASLSGPQRQALAKALAEHPQASRTLRRALRAVVPPPPPQPISSALTGIEALQLRHALHPPAPEPTARRLRRAGGSQRPAFAGFRRSAPVGSKPPVPPADGLCRVNEDHRTLRTCLGAYGAVGPAPRVRAASAACRKSGAENTSGAALCSTAADLPTCAARAECLLQPRAQGAAARLLLLPIRCRWRAQPDRVHRAVSRHHRPRNDACAARRHTPTLPRTDEP